MAPEDDQCFDTTMAPHHVGTVVVGPGGDQHPALGPGHEVGLDE